MRPHTEQLLAHLRHHHAELRKALDTIPEAKRRTKPAEARWSAAEIVEHLAIVEERFLMTVQRAPKEGPGPAESPLIHLDEAGLLNRAERIIATDANLPPGTLDAEAAWRRLDDLRTQLEHELIARDDIDLSSVTRDHPRFGPLNIYQWIFFAGAHEGRHALQMQEVGDELKGR